ncbi:MAG: hypothetical protein GY828_03330 [Candidatus Gracilibacteria bacterium]|nr:hypothetical protein [Candidatus Gracilibacteria bacterium]
MFYYEEKKEKYYIWSDKTTGKYGPFQGAYVKNKILGKSETSIEYSQYPAYKYAIGIGENKIFLFNEKGLEDIFEKTV